MGPAVEAAGKVEQLIAAGMNMARLKNLCQVIFLFQVTGCGFATQTRHLRTSRATKARGSFTWAAVCSVIFGNAINPSPCSVNVLRFTTGVMV